MANPKEDIKYTKLFINNEFVEAESGKKFKTINPLNETIIAEISEGDKADVDKAVAAARKAFSRGSTWRNLDASQRASLMHRLGDLIMRDATYIANIEALDTGKFSSQTVSEVQESVAVLRYYAGWCDKIQGSTIPSDGNSFTVTRKEPIGVVGQIIPWNAPLLMLIWKWATAMATGCTMVSKPAELTPLSALYVASLVKEAGFPPGVVNVVPGFGPTAGAAIAEHPDINKVAFTGSLEVGHIIMAAAVRSNLKRESLEPGEKSPLIIFDDADVEEAANIAKTVLVDCEQISCASLRSYIQDAIYDAFVERAKELADQIRTGGQFEPNVNQGPQIDQRMFNKVIRLIELGKIEGAVVQTGGERHGDVGFFVKPTVFSDETDDMTIAKEKIFRPVQSILKFDILEEVIERANKSMYGMADRVVTKDIEKALTVAQAVRAASVWEEERLHEYLESKTIVIRTPTKN